MKKYFAKYLPVKEEIKEGTLVQLNIPDGENPFSLTCGIFKRETPDVIHGKGYVTIRPTYKTGESQVDYAGLAIKKEWLGKPIRLSLCSKDIQLGDTYYHDSYYPYPNGDVADSNTKVMNAHMMITNEETGTPRESFKVIGKISPEATWVREDDEIDETQVQFWHDLEAGSRFQGGFVINPSLRPDWQGWVTDVKIKGPCGHFH